MALIVEELVKLSEAEQRLLVLAVMLDGVDAEWYLSFSPNNAENLAKLAKEVCVLQPDLRLQLSATILRQTLSGIDKRE